MRVSAIQRQFPMPKPRRVIKNNGQISRPQVIQTPASPSFKGAEGLIKGGYWGAVLGGLGGMMLMASGVGIPVALTYFGSIIGGAVAGGTIGNKFSGPDSQE